jgi:DNA-binding MarR family transcriptional regulator
MIGASTRIENAILTDSEISWMDTILTNDRKTSAFRELSHSAHAVLESFKNKPEIRLKTSDLVSETKLPRKTINNALKILLEEKFIQKYGQGAGVRYQLVF